MSSVNYGEIYYIVLRECGAKKVSEVDEIIDRLPIEFVNADRDLCREAARFKAFKRMSYADCFTAAVAKIWGGTILTGDPEFREVATELTVRWLPGKGGEV